MDSLTRGGKIFLSEAYEFRVKVQSCGHFFAGYLSLAPEKIKLHISGDLHEDRLHDLDPTSIDQLVCHSFDRKFVLIDLRFTNNHIHWLDIERRIRHFEYIYEASGVLVAPDGFGATEIHEINIHSPTVESWVGTTTSQHKFLTNYDRERRALLQNALSLEIYQRGTFEVAYRTFSHFSQETRSAGVGYEIFTSFTPSEYVSPQAAFEFIGEFRCLFEIIEGGDPLITMVHVRERELDAYLYYPTINARPRHPLSGNLFPLGRDLLHPRGLPEFPAASIAAFFSLEANTMERWRKTVRYRNLGVIEDRFLGAFRLIEAFTLQQSRYIQDGKLLDDFLARLKPIAIRMFGSERPKDVRGLLARIPRLNQSRYNTAACIQKFFKTLPTGLTSAWRFQLSDIPDICNKRNDITHANPYFFKDSDIHLWTAFVETLLFVALMDSIAVPRDATLRILPRLGSYTLLLKPEPANSLMG